MKFLVLIISFQLLLTGCSEKIESIDKPIRPVKFIEISNTNQMGTREFPGTLQSKNRVDLAFQVNGKLVSLPIKEGQDILKDQLIGELDKRDYQARYDAAVAEFKNAQANYERAKKLIKKEYISESDLDKLKTQKDQAESNVRLTQKALADTKLLAPFSGTIAKQYVRNFTDIQAKQSIVSLQDNANLEVVISVPEKILITNGDSRNNPNIQLKAKFSTLPDEVFDLKVNEYATEADSTTRTYKITLGILDKKNYNLYPGMSATVIASIENKDHSIYKIPASAVFSDPEGSDIQYVWKIDTNNQVHKSKVTLGQLSQNSIEILDGLKEGELIVTAGVHFLMEGQQVKRLKSFEAH